MKEKIIDFKVIQKRFKGRQNLKNMIRNRDEGKCRICGSRKWTEVTHIRSIKTYPSLAYEPMNLRLLCQECSRKRKKT